MSFSVTNAPHDHQSGRANLPRRAASRLFFFILIYAILTATLSAEASEPRIWMKVCDTTAYPNQEVVEICVMLDNYVDTIAGFSFWIQLDRPDLLTFQTAVLLIMDTTYWDCLEWADAVCVDSTLVLANGPWDFYHVDTNQVLRGLFDTTGTLISGWEYVDARSLSGAGTDVNVVGIANLPAAPITEGIIPQQGGMLVKLLGTALDVPDTVLERTVNLIVVTEFLEHTGFSTPNGTTIGLTYIPILDTICLMCNAWCGEVCCNYGVVEQIPPEGCDSMLITVDSIPILDSNQVTILNGSVEILMPLDCGDMDGDGSNGIVISDLTYLVSYLFNFGPGPIVLSSADCNGDGLIDIADLTCWICYLFLGCPQPTCQ